MELQITTTAGIDLALVDVLFKNNALGVTTYTQTGDSTVINITLAGSYEAICEALSMVTVKTKVVGGTSYDPNGDVHMKITVHDGVYDAGASAWIHPNGGKGSVYEATDTVHIYISPLNDAPEIANTGSMGMTMAEDDGYTSVLDSSSNPIHITDADAFERGGNSITLKVEHGTLLVDSLQGPRIEGQGSSTLVITGTLKNINDVLATLRYKPDADYNGTETIKFTYRDNANSGDAPDSALVEGDPSITPGVAYKYTTDGGKVGLAVDGEFVITVDPVNDAPTINAPDSLYLKENYTFNGTQQDTIGNTATIVLGDIDITGPGEFVDDTITVTLTVTGGTLTVDPSLVVTVTGGGSSLTLTGKLADVNTLLESLTYSPFSWNQVSDTLTILVSDPGSGGNVSNGSPTDAVLYDTHVITLYCSDVNDAPVITMPAGDWEIDEGSSGVTPFTGIHVTDIDSFTGRVFAAFHVDQGTLDISGVTGFNLSGNPYAQDGLFLSADKTTVYFKGTPAQIEAALAQIKYTPANADWNGEVAVTLYVNDLGYTGDPTSAGAENPVDSNPYGVPGSPAFTEVAGRNGLAATETHTLRVLSVNDAPTIAGGAASVDFWNNAGDADWEDVATGTAKSVDALFGALFRDTADNQQSNTGGSSSNAFAGVVITANGAAAATQGVWEYSSDGVAWTAVPTNLTEASALYLGKDAQLRFTPAANFNGVPGSLTAHLVDDSAAAPGNAALPSAASAAAVSGVDVSGTGKGGITRYSAAAVKLQTFVQAVNDAPVASGSASLTAVDEDASDPAGATVSALFNGRFSDAADNQKGPGGASASAANALGGIVIVGNAADAATQGVWQYSTSGGTTWDDLPADISAANGFYLSSSAMLRFVPAADWSGTPGGLTVYLADNSAADTAHGNPAAPASGSTTDRYDTTAANATGGTTRYSTGTVTLSTSVTAVNDAPVIINGSTETLATIIEDSALNPGTSVSALFASHFDDTADNEGTSSANGFAGVLVTGNAATAGQGVWQYSTDNGATWLTIPSVGAGKGFALRAAWQVRFNPAPDFNGTPGGLTVRLIDDSAAVPSGANLNPAAQYGALADIAAVGGVTRYSAGTLSLGISVTAVNDAPTIAVANPSLTHTEDRETVRTVGDVFEASFSDAKDEVTGGSSADAFAGVVLTGNTVTAGQGAWYYLDDSSQWVAIGTALADESGLFLSRDTQIKFVPAPDHNGVMGSLTARVVESGGAALATGARIDVNGTYSGGTTRISAAAATLGGTIAGVNDAPAVSNPTTPVDMTAIAEDTADAANAGDTVASLFSSRLDDSLDNLYDAVTNPGGSQANTLAGIIVQSLPDGAEAGKGTWQYKDAVTGWTAIEAGMFLAGDVAVRFDPAADFNGEAAGFAARLVENSGDYASTLPASGSKPTYTPGGESAVSLDSVSVRITVSAVNDAPTSSATSADFWGGNGATLGDREDTAHGNATAKTVSALFESLFRDGKDAQKSGDNPSGSEADAFAGIVIVGNAATAGQGVWEYSLDGVTWTAVDARGAGNGLYLDASAQLRFSPAPDFNGEPGALSVRLVDDSAADASHGNPALPANGGTVDLSGAGSGGTTRYSAGDVTLTTFVRAVNDAPVASGAASLAAVAEDTAEPAGATVSNLFGGCFSDAADGMNGTAVSGGSTSDSLAGVVLVKNDATAAQGTWQYLDGTWKDIDTNLSETNSLYLSGDTKIRFVPAADWNGTPGALTAHLADSSGEAASLPATGDAVDLSGAASKGGATRYSTGTVSLGTSVTPVNDAPVVVNGTTESLSAVAEDSDGGTGEFVSSLFSGHFGDSADTSGGSAANGLAGVLVTGNAATAEQGVWQYSTDGVIWTAISTTLTESSALYLGRDVLVRFNPASDFNGNPGALVARLVDDSATDIANGNPALPGTGLADEAVPGVDGTATGGNTRYSQGSVSLGVTVTPLNDAPTIVPGGETVTFDHTEDTVTVTTVGDLFGGSFSDATDDMGASNGSSSDTFQGVVITRNGATAAQGVWEYSTDGQNWTLLGSGMSETNGMYLDKGAYLRFTPAAEYNGELGDMAAHLVESGGAAYATGASVDVSGANRGGSTRVSASSVILAGTVAGVNDAPVALNPGTALAYPDTIHEDENVPGRTVEDIFGGRFSDARDAQYDATDNTTGTNADLFAGVIVSNAGGDAAKGVWQYEGASGWETISEGMFIGKDTKIRFQPAADWNGTAPELKAHVVERSGAYAATVPASGTMVGLAQTGGASPVSSDALTLGATVLAVNDAPGWNGDAFSPLPEDPNKDSLYVGEVRYTGGNSNILETTVEQALTGRGNIPAFQDETDAVPGGSSADALQGILITGNASTPLGTWQYYDSVTGWTDIPPATPDNAFYLAKDAGLRFVYDTSYSIPVDGMTHAFLEVALVETSDGNSMASGTGGHDASAGARGGASSVSADSVPLWVSVVPRNYYPEFVGAPQSVSTHEREDVQLAPGVSVEDLNLDNATSANHWGGASVTIRRDGGANADDVFGALAGSGLSDLTENTEILLNGVSYGTVGRNSGGELTLVFNNNATADKVAEILRAVVYRNDSHTPPASVDLQWSIDDGNYERDGVPPQGLNNAGDASGTAVHVQTVFIEAVNDAPQGVDDAALVSSEATEPIQGNVLDNDWDWDNPHGDLFVASSEASSARYGTLTINADGSYEYTVNVLDEAVMALKPGESLTETIRYTVSDGSLTSTAELRITVEKPMPQGQGFVTKCEDDADPFRKVTVAVPPSPVLVGAVSGSQMDLSVDKPVVRGVEEVHNALNTSRRNALAALRGNSDASAAEIAERYSITLSGRLEQQTMYVGVSRTLPLPRDLFKHSRPGERLFYSVTLADGGPLPAWLSWHGDSMSLSGLPDKVPGEPLVIRVTARDQYNNSAVAFFHLVVADGPDTGNSEAAAPADIRDGDGDGAPARDSASRSSDAAAPVADQPDEKAGAETVDSGEGRPVSEASPGDAGWGAPGLERLVAQSGQQAMLLRARECIRLLM